MTLVQGFKYAIKDFKKIINVAKLSIWQMMLYILFLATLLSLPVVWQFGQSVMGIKEDAKEIAQNIPEFTVEGGHLTASEGGIFLTDSLIVTLAPNKERTEEDVISDATSSAIAIGLFPDKITIALPNNQMTTSILGSSHFSISYKEAGLAGFSKKELQESLTLRLPWWMYALLFILVLYPVMLNFLINIFLITACTTLAVRFFGIRIRFGAGLKMIVFSSTWSVIIMTLLNFTGLVYNEIFVMVVLTMLVFYQVIKSILPPRTKNS